VIKLASLEDVFFDILNFNDKYYNNWRETPEVFLSNALAGECGELCNMVKHRCGGGTKLKDVSNTELFEEMADIFIYMSMLLSVNGGNIYTLKKAISDKLIINAERMDKRLKDAM
jgi:NTP pyrophosphatase (non-canonical NTP hydrolase)